MENWFGEEKALVEQVDVEMGDSTPTPPTRGHRDVRPAISDKGRFGDARQKYRGMELLMSYSDVYRCFILLEWSNNS